MMRARLGQTECDPFWTAQNGGCSDQFGQYIYPTTGPQTGPMTTVDPETGQWVTVGTSGKSGVSISPTVAVLLIVGAFVAISFVKGR